MGCVPPQGPGINDGSGVREDEEYDRRKDDDDNRGSVFDRSRSRRSGNICEDEDRDHECKEQCKEMYRRIGDRDDCEELTVAQIGVLFELWEFLKEPDEDDLPHIDAEDFDVYLNVSISSLDNLVDDWNNRETKEFLYWMINNENIAKIFEKEDNDYKTFTAILKNLNGNFGSSTIYEPFLQKIERDKLMEVAIDSGNEMVIEWFMDYINDENSDCKDEDVSKDCFEVYCKIGKGIDEDFMEQWLDYPVFEDHIDDIIQNGVNATNPGAAGGDATNDINSSGWTFGDDDGEFENFGDISDDWVTDLCHDLG
ncbi:MAG: hypothetical protein OXJ52_09600 [Oligoflexia bacterium]|nr:hypothetical protein [Oligoflexia bacterium]